MNVGASDYFGLLVNRSVRLLSAGHGGQILLSLAAQELVRDALPEGTDLRDLGERYLKDLLRPERVFQLTAPDLPSSFSPLPVPRRKAQQSPHLAYPTGRTRAGTQGGVRSLAQQYRRQEPAPS